MNVRTEKLHLNEGVKVPSKKGSQSSKNSGNSLNEERAGGRDGRPDRGLTLWTHSTVGSWGVKKEE